MSFAFMPLYTGDYLRDTRHLSPLRHGIYLLLLMHCWDQKGPVPLDEQEAAGVANCRSAEDLDSLRYVLERFFVRMADGHYSKRMAEEIARSERLSGLYSEAGRRSGEVRRASAAKRAAARDDKEANEPRLNPGSTAAEPRLNRGGSPPPPPPPPPSPSLTGSNEPVVQQPTAVASGRQRAKRAAQPAAAISADAWTAYSGAYQSRYGVMPVRNARVNSHLSRFVQLIGAEESPAVIRSYVLNRNGLYVAAKHCTDLLLRDAEKLRTEWATGNVTHQRDAREEDRLSSTGAMWERVDAKLKTKGIT